MIKQSRNAIVGYVNDQKIIALHNGNCGVHQIVGVFRDENIHVTPEYVSGVISMQESNYNRKFLPNDAVKTAINGKQEFSNENCFPA